MAEKQYYPIEVTTSNGIILSGDYIIATPDGVPLLAAFFDRAKAKVKACACQFGSGMVRFGWDRFYTARYEFGTVYKPVRMGRDRFIYAFTYNKEIGDNYLITTKESFHKDFYNLLLNKFHLPIMEEWIPYLLAAGHDKGYFFEIRYLKKRCADHERKVPVNGKMIPVTELNVVDLRQLTEERLKELISSGLKEKKICISKTEQAPLDFSSFDEYITRYGSAIVDKLEKQLKLAEKTNADIVYCSYGIIDDKGNRTCTDFIVEKHTSYDKMLARNVISCSTALIKKEYFNKYSFSSEYAHEDYALWMEMLRDGLDAYGNTEILAYYRLYSGTRSSNKIKAAKNRWIIYRKHLKMSFIHSLCCIIRYMFKALKKYKHVS